MCVYRNPDFPVPGITRYVFHRGGSRIRTYIIRMEKEQKEEVKENYPNLAKAPAYLNVAKFNINADLTTATDQQIETLVKEKLREIDKTSFNPDYTVERREKLYLVDTEDYRNPVFEAEMRIPQHLRG